MWDLGEGELQWALELKPTPRYAYAVNKIKEHGELWMLNSSGGWCLAKGETSEVGVPVWPHPEFAIEHATGDWADCFPESIPLAVWLDADPPQFVIGATHVSVFFTHERGSPYSSIQVSAEKFASDLRAPYAQRYEIPKPTR